MNSYELYSGGSIVVSCGSGVTISGIIKGLGPNPKKMIGVSSGRSIKKIKDCISKYCTDLPAYLDLTQITHWKISEVFGLDLRYSKVH